MDVNVLADAAPEDKEDQDESGLDLQADIPSHVDEQGINMPSAQITLAVPTESTLLEVSEEEKSDNQPVEETGDEAKEGATESDGQSGGDCSRFWKKEETIEMI